MMACRDIDDLLLDHLYGELEAGRETEFRSHVESCARCRAEVGGLERTRQAARTALPLKDPPPAASARILAEAARASREQGAFGWLSGAWRLLVAHPAVAVAASMVVVAGVAGLLTLGGKVEVRPRPAAEPPPAVAEPPLAPPPIRLDDGADVEAAAARPRPESVVPVAGPQDTRPSAPKKPTRPPKGGDEGEAPRPLSPPVTATVPGDNLRGEGNAALAGDDKAKREEGAALAGQLYEEARRSAQGGACDSALALRFKINSVDPEFYAKNVAGDPLFAQCERVVRAETQSKAAGGKKPVEAAAPADPAPPQPASPDTNRPQQPPPTKAF